jgi:hypothetical protein
VNLRSRIIQVQGTGHPVCGLNLRWGGSRRRREVVDGGSVAELEEGAVGRECMETSFFSGGRIQRV